MGAAGLGAPLTAGNDEATVVLNPLAAHAALKACDVEAAAATTTHTPAPARAAAAAVLGHAAAFWGLFLGVGTNGQPAAVAAATAAYEATALLTAATLGALWAWSRRCTTTSATTTTPPPPLLSIPALAVLFGLQWAAFTYLLIAGCGRA